MGVNGVQRSSYNIIVTLDNDTFPVFAMSHYIHPGHKTQVDFNEDVNRILYIRKLLNRITAGESVEPLLILNHLRILFNVFDSDAIVAMLYFRIDRELWGLLKTFLDPFGANNECIPHLNISIADISTVESTERDIKNAVSNRR